MQEQHGLRLQDYTVVHYYLIMKRFQNNDSSEFNWMINLNFKGQEQYPINKYLADPTAGASSSWSSRPAPQAPSPVQL
jgi:hypothetical protein